MMYPHSLYISAENEETGNGKKMVLREGGHILVGPILKNINRGMVRIDVPDEDEKRTPTYMIWGKDNEELASGLIAEPGKYKFWIAKDRNPKSKKMIGRMSFESEADLSKKRQLIDLCKKGNPMSWDRLTVIEHVKTGEPSLAVVMKDKSILNVRGKAVDECIIRGRLWRNRDECFARAWRGRGLVGIWNTRDNNMPFALRRALLSASLTEEKSRFPLFTDNKDLATVLNLKGGRYEITTR